MMAMLSGIISVLEISIFGFLGNLVDWLGARDPQSFFTEEGRSLWMISGVILVLLPLAGFLHSLLLHQTIFGNFVMTIRWKAHQWMLGQSYSFYQDEFAGRVATKVMQTSCVGVFFWRDGTGLIFQRVHDVAVSDLADSVHYFAALFSPPFERGVTSAG